MGTYKRPAGMKYTDMCIYIDSKLEYLGTTEEPDLTVVENVYKYLYLFVYALACKQKYFRDAQDYEDFSLTAASILYMRMVDKRQYLPDDDPRKIKPVKSSRNYIESALRGLKVNYQQEYFSPSVHPKLLGEIDYSSNTKDFIENENSEQLQDALIEEFSALPEKIKKILKTTPYRKNNTITKNLYISLLLSFIDCITPNNNFLMKCDNSNLKSKDLDSKKIKIYLDQQNNNPVLYHLPDEMSDYVKVLLNIVKKELAKNIIDTRASFSLSDETIRNIVASIYEENDSGDYYNEY